MAKLYFYYSAMNAGKTTGLLQSAFNYRERGMDVLLFVSHKYLLLALLLYNYPLNTYCN